MSSLDCSPCWSTALSFSTGCVYFTFLTLWFSQASTLPTITSSHAPQGNMKAQVRHWNWWEGNGDSISCQPWARGPYGPLKPRDASSTSFYRVSTQRSLADGQSHPSPQGKVLHGAPESHRRRPATRHNSNQVYHVKASPTAHRSTQSTQSVSSTGGGVC